MVESTIPVTQRAAVLHGPYGVGHGVEDFWPVISPSPGEALVQIQAASLCAGDVHFREGWYPAPPIAVRSIVTYWT
jgi:Zn-dependent alcohol dehydrogenase